MVFYPVKIYLKSTSLELSNDMPPDVGKDLQQKLHIFFWKKNTCKMEISW